MISEIPAILQISDFLKKFSEALKKFYKFLASTKHAESVEECFVGARILENFINVSENFFQKSLI